VGSPHVVPGLRPRLEKSRLGGKVGRIVVCQRVPIYILMPKAITAGNTSEASRRLAENRGSGVEGKLTWFEKQ
jgi:hypothetical protein